MPNKFKVNLSAKKLVADWPEPKEPADSDYISGAYDRYGELQEVFHEKEFNADMMHYKANLEIYNSRPSYPISEEGLKVWKDGQVLEEGEFELFECDMCDGCGWHEGGKALKTTCNKCSGAGAIAIPKSSDDEIKKDDKLINHLRNVKLLQAIHESKKFYVECYPTDEGAIHFPNSNFAVKEIELPNFDLYEEKLGYKWVKDSINKKNKS